VTRRPCCTAWCAPRPRWTPSPRGCALEAGNGKVGWQFATGGPVDSGPATDSGGAVYVGNNRGDIYEADSDPQDNPIWTFRAQGAIGGTPATDGVGTLYAGSADSFVYAVTLSGGTQIWAYRTGGAARSGPALSEGILYAGSDDGYLHAIDVATGNRSWRYRTGGAIRSQILVADGVVYFGSLDHRVYALRVQV
jgi:outer membrane protein assembly factor BamB